MMGDVVMVQQQLYGDLANYLGHPSVLSRCGGIQTRASRLVVCEPGETANTTTAGVFADRREREEDESTRESHVAEGRACLVGNLPCGNLEAHEPHSIAAGFLDKPIRDVRERG